MFHKYPNCGTSARSGSSDTATKTGSIGLATPHCAPPSGLRRFHQRYKIAQGVLSMEDKPTDPNFRLPKQIHHCCLMRKTYPRIAIFTCNKLFSSVVSQFSNFFCVNAVARFVSAQANTTAGGTPGDFTACCSVALTPRRCPYIFGLKPLPDKSVPVRSHALFKNSQCAAR
ncbi:hypothetical protein EJ08DRAFT_695304 [Tothia fuscella]|uniref:Uncharacterized protein n=1 Tax=Tothia fuscella TaxID=1048955 RepID=A0A9P4NVS8_9PEZI|nr:hypothetical protein EJ08DRAFT_695304 [Tothia fuscella]